MRGHCIIESELFKSGRYDKTDISIFDHSNNEPSLFVAWNEPYDK